MAKATLSRPGLSGVAAALVALCIALAAAAPGALAAGGATAVACRLAGEGFGRGGGAVSLAISEAPKSLQSRACELNKGFGFRPALSECQRLYDDCKKSKALQDAFAAGRKKKLHVFSDAIIVSEDSFDVPFDGKALGGGALPARGGTPSSNDVDAAGGALAAAFAGLERGDMSGATPEAVATACTLARRQNLLQSACAQSLPCSAASDSAYERVCLDVFRKGESKLPTARDVDIDITDTMSSIWKANHPGERAIRREFVHTDCCDKISSSECRCDMRKRIIRESGKAPTAWCLNTKELQSCKP